MARKLTGNQTWHVPALFDVAPMDVQGATYWLNTRE